MVINAILAMAETIAKYVKSIKSRVFSQNKYAYELQAVMRAMTARKKPGL